MVLGREGSSGARCYLCHLSAKEFSKSLEAGDEWSYKEMNDFVRKMQESNAKVKKPVEGCKELAWWQMIPLSHFLVPLLHTLIGIGNDIYDNFRDIVNEHIECLDRKEIETRRKVAECEMTIESEKSRRNAWDASEKGKKFLSLKGIIYRRSKVLKDLGCVGNGSSVKVCAAKADDIDELLKEYDEYVAGDEDDDGGDEESGASSAVSVPNEEVVPADGNSDVVNALLQSKIKDYRAIIAQCQKEMAPLQAERAVFENSDRTKLNFKLKFVILIFQKV
jgi:hypothetical protein